jgi:hypothetical protein
VREILAKFINVLPFVSVATSQAIQPSVGIIGLTVRISPTGSALLAKHPAS